MTGHRQSYRLQGYDYSHNGCYYVTICTQNRACIFGQILDKKMHLSQCGEIAHQEWLRSANLRDELVLDTFLVMPNHLHGIVFIDKEKGDQPVTPTLGNGPRPRSLGAFIAGYKSSVSKRITQNQTDAGVTGRPPSTNAKQTVWQRNYHDHIIRDKAELERIRQYIQDNPKQWDTDPPHIY